MVTRGKTDRKAKASKFRYLLIASLSMAVTPGCATMKSPTEWFAKNPEQQAEKSSFTSTVSNTGKGIAGQFKSMGTAVSSAMGKAKNAVVAPFTTTDDPSAATSLANLPNNLGPEVWVANGQLFESQGNYAKALDNYSKALEREPNNEAALLSTARLYARQDDNTQAVEFYQKALATNPKNAATHNELAMLLQESGNNVEAQNAIQQAIALDPSNARYRNNLAGMLVAVGRSDEAVKQLEQVFPPAVANYNVAYLHFSNNNTAGAQQHLELALRADPNLQQARQLLDRLSGSAAGQTAIAAYDAANTIYRTAQAAGSPTQAGAAVYQQAGVSAQQFSGSTTPNPYTQSPPSNAYSTPAASTPAGFSAPNYPATNFPPSSHPAMGATGAPSIPAGTSYPQSPASAPTSAYPSSGTAVMGLPVAAQNPATRSSGTPTVGYPTYGATGTPASTVSYPMSPPSAGNSLPAGPANSLLPPPDMNRYNAPTK